MNRALGWAVLAPAMALVFAGTVSGCSSSAKKSTQHETPDSPEVADLRHQVSSLQSKVDTLQGQLAATSKELEITRASAADAAMNVKPAKSQGVTGHAAESRGAPVEAAESAGDPEGGFVQDASILSYRQAMILFQTKKYAEAILAFSSFLERYADHALAGSAQFHVGESYYRQKEFKLAHQEFGRVLTSYDRSPRVPEALARMAELEDLLKRGDEAAQHRQALASLFPGSPAAAPAPRGVRADAPSSPSAPSSSSSKEPAQGPKDMPPLSATTPSNSANSAAGAAPRAASVPIGEEPPATAPLPAESSVDAPPESAPPAKGSL